MRHIVQTAWRGHATAWVFALGLAWIGMLSPGIALAQSADELGIQRMSMSATGLGGVRIEGINQGEPIVKKLGRNGSERDLTAPEVQDITALVAALADIDEGTLKLEADLAPYHDSAPKLIRINISADYPIRSGKDFNLRNIFIQHGAGELDPEIAALLTRLMSYLEAPAADEEAS